jgi:hypothetical protein
MSPPPPVPTRPTHPAPDPDDAGPGRAGRAPTIEEVTVKIRIGYGLGRESRVSTRATLGPLVDALEERSFDSLWFSERLGSAAPDPIAAMAFAVARTEKLKVGMS